MKQLHAGQYSKYPQIRLPATARINGIRTTSRIKKIKIKVLQHFIQAKCNFHSSHVTQGSGVEESVCFLGILIIARWLSPPPNFIIFKPISRVLFPLCFGNTAGCRYEGTGAQPLLPPHYQVHWSTAAFWGTIPTAPSISWAPAILSSRSCPGLPKGFQQLPADG